MAEVLKVRPFFIIKKLAFMLILKLAHVQEQLKMDFRSGGRQLEMALITVKFILMIG